MFTLTMQHTCIAPKDTSSSWGENIQYSISTEKCHRILYGGERSICESIVLIKMVQVNLGFFTKGLIIVWQLLVFVPINFHCGNSNMKRRYRDNRKGEARIAFGLLSLFLIMLNWQPGNWNHPAQRRTAVSRHPRVIMTPFLMQVSN